MMEFKQYSFEYAETFAIMRNNPNVLDNGYDKTPNPFTKNDAIDLINIQIEKKYLKDFLYFIIKNWLGKLELPYKKTYIDFVQK
jgi:[ribosomal protein S5]-alanine N-acetyltransferase